MSIESSTVSRKRSATEATHTVSFPSARYSDFVIHHRGSSYHAHKLVLCHHSAYFRTYIDALRDGERAYSSEECSEHASIPHCIRLPDSCGKVEASSADFQRYLCHLYFAQHHNTIPFIVASDVDLSVQPPPTITLDWPKLSSWE